jgi:hypothetical protein
MHTRRYCRHVPQKRVGWWASPGSVSEDRQQDAVVHVYNDEFPGWRFTVTFSYEGTAVGFAVMAPGPVATGWQYPGRPARRSSPPTAGVTARWLRSIPIGEIQDAARRGFVGRLQQSPSDAELGEHWGTVFAEAPKPGRRGRDDRAYAEMAALYVAELADNPRSAVQTLGDRLGYAGSQVRSILSEARRRGLLTKPPARGIAGGQLTAKATALLRKD